MNSAAYDDINPSAPSRVSLARRIRTAREMLQMAEERLNEGEIGMADHWLNRASKAAYPTRED